MQVSAPNFINEKSNNSQSFKGKVSPELYKQRIPRYADDKFLKAKKELDTLISKCGDDLVISQEGKYNIVAKIANVAKLKGPRWKVNAEPYCMDDLIKAYLYTSDSLKEEVLPLFEKISSTVGIDNDVLDSYEDNAVNLALHNNLSPEEVAELRKDCATLLKYQKRNRIGYEKDAEFPFTWTKVKEALEINGIDPNPSKELLLERQEAREKFENSFKGRMKRFFGIEK